MEKETATYSSLLAEEIRWTEEPGSPWGHKESDRSALSTQSHTHINMSTLIPESDWAHKGLRGSHIHTHTHNLFKDSAQTSNSNNVKRPGEEENSTTSPRSPVPDQRPCAPGTKQGLFSCLLSGFDSWLIKKMTLNLKQKAKPKATRPVANSSNSLKTTQQNKIHWWSGESSFYALVPIWNTALPSFRGEAAESMKSQSAHSLKSLTG